MPVQGFQCFPKELIASSYRSQDALMDFLLVLLREGEELREVQILKKEYRLEVFLEIFHR